MWVSSKCDFRHAEPKSRIKLSSPPARTRILVHYYAFLRLMRHLFSHKPLQPLLVEGILIPSKQGLKTLFWKEATNQQFQHGSETRGHFDPFK